MVQDFQYYYGEAGGSRFSKWLYDLRMAWHAPLNRFHLGFADFLIAVVSTAIATAAGFGVVAALQDRVNTAGVVVGTVSVGLIVRKAAAFLVRKMVTRLRDSEDRQLAWEADSRRALELELVLAGVLRSLEDPKAPFVTINHIRGILDAAASEIRLRNGDAIRTCVNLCLIVWSDDGTATVVERDSLSRARGQPIKRSSEEYLGHHCFFAADGSPLALPVSRAVKHMGKAFTSAKFAKRQRNYKSALNVPIPGVPRACLGLDSPYPFFFWPEEKVGKLVHVLLPYANLARLVLRCGRNDVSALISATRKIEAANE